MNKWVNRWSIDWLIDWRARKLETENVTFSGADKEGFFQQWSCELGIDLRPLLGLYSGISPHSPGIFLRSSWDLCSPPFLYQICFQVLPYLLLFHLCCHILAQALITSCWSGLMCLGQVKHRGRGGNREAISADQASVDTCLSPSPFTASVFLLICSPHMDPLPPFNQLRLLT